MQLKKVYDIHFDERGVKAIQDATLHTKDYGLDPHSELIGTPEWYKAIDKGKFKKITLEGKISKVYMSGHNDFAEFELENDSGKRSFPRDSNLGKDQDYKNGKQIRVVYVKQKLKKRWPPDFETYSEIVLEIWIEP